MTTSPRATFSRWENVVSLRWIKGKRHRGRHLNDFLVFVFVCFLFAVLSKHVRNRATGGGRIQRLHSFLLLPHHVPSEQMEKKRKSHQILRLYQSYRQSIVHIDTRHTPLSVSKIC